MDVKTLYSRSAVVGMLAILAGLGYGVEAAVPMKYNFSIIPIAGYQSITPKSVYNTKQGFGFDFGFDSAVTYTAAKDGIEGKKSVKNPKLASWTGDPFYLPTQQAFFFSVDVPRGNYQVTITLGNKDSAVTATIRAEQRRLMIENWQVPAGQSQARTIDVNRRSDTVAGTNTRIGITTREQTYVDLDGRLTIEFNGNRPVVQQMVITPVDTDITVYLAGNSTVVDQPQEPWSTWGVNFPRFFKSGVAISDQAESGLTSSSFIAQGRLNNINSTLKAGDYLFVEFGHNDMKSTAANKMDVFKSAVLQFIAVAKAKKATAVLVSPTARLSFSGNTAANTLEAYPDSMKAIAKEQGVPFLDLNGLSSQFITALGPSNAAKAYTHFAANTVPGQTGALADNTHWNDYGGYELAKAMATAVKAQSANFTFAKYLSDDYVNFLPTTPDPYASFQLPFSPFMGTFQPPDSAVTTMLSAAAYAKSGIRIASTSFRNGVLSLRVNGAEDGLEVRVVDLDGEHVASGFMNGQSEILIPSLHGYAHRIHVVEIVRDGVIVDEQKVLP